ncbi:PH domain-containing protein [Mucilaginibacter litoreus]|uniref:PH domain-containing protein n=1 Tax=Mucilaginibacter litoreus TaxID=1048221 RepID=A0ABW3APU8_9SPHI
MGEIKVYTSKKGIIVFIPLLILTGVIITGIITGEYWPAVICTLLLAILILPMLFNTNYTITGDNKLIVKCGLLINQSIDIVSIKKITPTKSILSSPALSLDRLEVTYNKFDAVIISPENKENFVADLQNINPAIEYVNKSQL